MADSGLRRIADEDLPALYQAADNASVDAQKRYLWLLRADLSVVVLGSAATSVAVSTAAAQAGLAMSGAGLMFAGAILTTIVLQQQPDKTWFNSRAVAESVKTTAWRYMVCAEPFPRSSDARLTDAQFCSALDEILKENRAVGGALGGVKATGQQITTRMREVRALETAGRLDTYLSSRLRDQREWYASKASYNSRTSGRWLWAVAATQLAAALAAIAWVRWPDVPMNSASVLASLAAAFVAWLQIKRHQDLSHSYGVAAHELGLIESQSPHIETDDELSDFVIQAERAVSREHTMWVARRSE